MYRWCVDFKRVVNDELKMNCYSCNSFTEALKDADRIWKSISEDEKKKIYRFSLQTEKSKPFSVRMDSIHLEVKLTETDDEGHIIDIFNGGVYECQWLYKHYCIMKWDTHEVVEKYDTYAEALNSIKTYPNPGEYVLCSPDGEENSDFTWLVFDRIVSYSNLRPEKFANTFGIPKRTVDNWIYSVNQPTEYLLGMIAKEVAEYVKVHDVWGGEGRNV